MHKDWCYIGEVPCCFTRSSVKFQHNMTRKFVDLVPNWAFPDCKSSLNSPMATKFYDTQSLKKHKRCHIVLKVICKILRSCVTKTSSILTQIGRFQTVTPVWIGWWLWKDAQSLRPHGKRALLFLKVIHHISRSHRTKTLPISTRVERFRTVTPVWIY